MPALLVATLLAGCETAAPAAIDSSPTSASPKPTSTPPTHPSQLMVAFIRDLAPEESLAVATPAQQAVELAFATAPLHDPGTPRIDVVAFDTEGDPVRAAEIAAEVAGDPAYIAAFAAPNLADQAALAERLGPAGIPLLSLSARSTVDSAVPGTWLRLVAPVEDQATALARAATSLNAARRGVCVMSSPSDGSVYSRRILRSIGDSAVLAEVTDVAEAGEAGCGVVVWTGDAAGGARIAVGLTELEDPPRFVGGAPLLEPGFLQDAGAGAEGARSLCSCADVSTSLDLAAQRFIQDFQSEFGSPPGPFAVEAWDAAHVLLRGLREAGASREAIVAWLAGTTAFAGLGGRYALRGGELADPAGSMRVYSVDGGRWILVAADEGR